MLMRYGQAAILAVLATLMGTTVWAQDYVNKFTPADCCKKAKSCNAKGSCATGACCKDGKCCKDKKCEQAAFGMNGMKDRNFEVIGVTLAIKGGDCCCKNKKCDASCTCCKDSKCECCKDSKCSCKDKSGCCCNAKKCSASCACCKDSKCECGKSGDCCCKGKTSVAKKNCGCPFLNKLAKNTAIIMVMPSSLPLLGACPPAAMGMMPHPPIPMDPRVMLPPPPMMIPPGLPPMPGMAPPMMPPHAIAMPVPPSPGYCPSQMAMPILPCPPTPDAMSKANSQVDTCMQLLGLASELCSMGRPMSTASVCASVLELLMDMCPAQPSIPEPTAPLVMHHLQYVIPAPRFSAPCPLNTQEAAEVNPNCCGVCGKVVAMGQPIMSCPVGTPAASAKVRIIAVPSSTELEMNVGDETCVRCKKMTVKIGDNAITVSRFEDRVRVRGEELKATADSVRSDRKDRIILEGDVVLHYKKDGHCANVTGDRIELNLNSGAVTIKPAEKAAMTRPSVRIDVIDDVIDTNTNNK